MNLNELLNTQECKYLDFKRQWHKDTADLILDILCMANSDAETDRYMMSKNKKFMMTFLKIESPMMIYAT